MRTANLISKALTVLACLYFCTSCSIEKRHYMSGYHFEWTGHNRDMTRKSKAYKHENPTSIVSSTKAKTGASNETTVEQNNDNAIASTESQQINFNETKRNIFSTDQEVVKEETVTATKSENTHLKKPGDKTQPGDKMSNWAIAGLIISAVGFALLFASSMLGLVFSILGLIACIGGMIETHSGEIGGKGFWIAGLIICIFGILFGLILVASNIANFNSM
jgi:hypothetical protein